MDSKMASDRGAMLIVKVKRINSEIEPLVVADEDTKLEYQILVQMNLQQNYQVYYIGQLQIIKQVKPPIWQKPFIFVWDDDPEKKDNNET